MDVQHDPDSSDDSGPVPDDLAPLSFFFPELTDEEARTIDGETVAIMERRAKVMGLYRRNLSMRAIAQQVGCNFSTVCRDVRAVLAGYRKYASRGAREHLADALQRLAATEADFTAQWDKSKGELVESTALRRSGRAATESASVKRRQQYGDPRLGALILRCQAQRSVLLGLMSRDLAKFLGQDGDGARKNSVVIEVELGPETVSPPGA